MLTLAIAVAAPRPGVAQETAVDNGPATVRQDLRLSEIPVHDPYIVPHEPTQTYYLYTSAFPEDTGEDRYGVKAYTSDDLVNWEGPHIVFTIPDDSWADPMDGAWAPEVHEYNGRYYLFVSLHNEDEVLAEPPEVWRTNHLRGGWGSSFFSISNGPLSESATATTVPRR